MALEGIGGLLIPELHDVGAVFFDPAIAIIKSALSPRQYVLFGHTEPATLRENVAHFVFISLTPDLGLQNRLGQGLGRNGVGIDPISPQTQGFFGMVIPQFTRRHGAEAFLLVNELSIPGFTDTKCFHRLRLHIGHHLGRRHHNYRYIIIGINPGGG